jgi:hypothetical protein
VENAEKLIARIQNYAAEFTKKGDIGFKLKPCGRRSCAKRFQRLEGSDMKYFGGHFPAEFFRSHDLETVKKLNGLVDEKIPVEIPRKSIGQGGITELANALVQEEVSFTFV